MATATLSITTGIADDSAIPGTYVLHQNHPNTFNPTTTIRYGLPEDTHVTLTIYDLVGRKVAVLTNSHQQVGWQKVKWNGRNTAGYLVGNGVYLYHLRAGKYQETKSIVILK
ncbi:MAG: T9SS type A sorting domain-containing protein [Candidatus Marinimicrobia bacterium]|nr:T9SS type A sorting domain-containing protein [Candidatus Neomarinimicrobiota bacterium]MCF7880199.1 T9SS type A sorting domain-containing protein [Candidatus Neomarinimicrobiota bacterium]